MNEPVPAGVHERSSERADQRSGAHSGPRSIVVASSGVHFEVLVAAPLGLLIVAAGVAGPLAQLSLASGFAGLVALGFGVPVLVSCAYSVWGTCSLIDADDGFVVVHALGPWRWTWRFARSRIRSVFVYKPPPAYILWPGASGRHVRVLLRDTERSVPVGAGMHAPNETLEEIRAMLALT